MWTYLKKGDKVIGKHNLSEERLENYIEMGYSLCEEDDCHCIDEEKSVCEPSKPKSKPKKKSKKKEK